MIFCERSCSISPRRADGTATDVPKKVDFAKESRKRSGHRVRDDKLHQTMRPSQPQAARFTMTLYTRAKVWAALMMWEPCSPTQWWLPKRAPSLSKRALSSASIARLI
ncbi:hypothetical protein N182_36400 [Sinorhizobium sp. GL2]|nr:hypothetical protein N182_36400 [Sinorhizobium sp. GL2]